MLDPNRVMSSLVPSQKWLISRNRKNATNILVTLNAILSLQGSVSNLSSVIFCPPFITETRWYTCNSKPYRPQQFFNHLVQNSKKINTKIYTAHERTGGRVSWHIQLPTVVIKQIFELLHCRTLQTKEQKSQIVEEIACMRNVKVWYHTLMHYFAKTTLSNVLSIQPDPRL